LQSILSLSQNPVIAVMRVGHFISNCF